jgi:hypothetical protein
VHLPVGSAQDDANSFILRCVGARVEQVVLHPEAVEALLAAATLPLPVAEGGEVDALTPLDERFLAALPLRASQLKACRAAPLRLSRLSPLSRRAYHASTAFGQRQGDNAAAVRPRRLTWVVCWC